MKLFVSRFGTNNAIHSLVCSFWIVLSIAIKISAESSQNSVTQLKFSVTEKCPVGTFVGQLLENDEQLHLANGYFIITSPNTKDWTEWFDEKQLSIRGRIVTSGILDCGTHSEFAFDIYDSVNSKVYQVTNLLGRFLFFRAQRCP